MAATTTPPLEGVDDEPVQDVAVDIAAHAAGAMPAGQQQGVDSVETGLRPRDWVLKLV